MSAHVHYDLATIEKQVRAAHGTAFAAATAAARHDGDLAWLALQSRLWEATLPLQLAIFEEWNRSSDPMMIAKALAMMTSSVEGLFIVNSKHEPAACLSLIDCSNAMLSEYLDQQRGGPGRYYAEVRIHREAGGRA